MRQGLSGKAPDGAARLAFAFGGEGGASAAVVGGRWMSPSSEVSSAAGAPRAAFLLGVPWCGYSLCLEECCWGGDPTSFRDSAGARFH